VRAFLYAGAASVLCTQWKVADESTAALMVRFYTHYRAGDPKDVALQKAMCEIRTGPAANGSALRLPAELSAWRREWSHPCYWAPFILVGERRREPPDARAGG
jgi:CHAT domain-containing protein